MRRRTTDTADERCTWHHSSFPPPLQASTGSSIRTQVRSYVPSIVPTCVGRSSSTTPGVSSPSTYVPLRFHRPHPCATVSSARGSPRTNSSGSLLGLPLHPPTSRELTSSLLDAEGTHEPEGEGERGARWRQPGHTNWHRQTRGGAAWQVRGRVRGAPSDVRRSKRPHVDPKGCREGWRRGPASRGPRQMSSPCTIEKPREEIDRSSRRKTSTRANATGCWTSANPRTKTANPARAEARNPPP